MTSELRECLIGYRGCLPEGDVPPSALSLCFDAHVLLRSDEPSTVYAVYDLLDPVCQYFMFNAAVATECFDGSLQNADEAVRNKYVPPQWRTYNTRAWSANWFSWFTGDADDARNRMGWVDRFAAVLNNADAVFNYYSTGDEVFHETPNPPWLLEGMSESGANYCWQKQETLKGTRQPAGTLSGGWGFYLWQTQGALCRYSDADADRMVSDGSITGNSVFDRSYTPMFSPNATEDEVFMALAKYVPAVSSPVGGCAVLSSDENEGDLNDSRYRSGWVGDTSRGNDWKHSDMKDVAYFYVWPLYNELVNEKGNLK